MYRKVYKVRENGKLVAHGTAKECAGQLGITFGAFWARIKRGDPRIREVKKDG